MPNSGEHKRRRMLKLWEASKNCHWCGTPMVLVFRPPGSNQATSCLFLNNEATIDHLHSRYDGYHAHKPGEEVTVLACRQCNNVRNKTQQELIPVEELRRMAGRCPKALEAK